MLRSTSDFVRVQVRARRPSLCAVFSAGLQIVKAVKCVGALIRDHHEARDFALQNDLMRVCNVYPFTTLVPHHRRFSLLQPVVELVRPPISTDLMRAISWTLSLFIGVTHSHDQ